MLVFLYIFCYWQINFELGWVLLTFTVKIATFSIRLALYASLGEGGCRNIAMYSVTFGTAKTRLVRLTDGWKCFRTSLAVLTEYLRLTGRQTDKQTHILRHHSPRYSYGIVISRLRPITLFMTEMIHDRTKFTLDDRNKVTYRPGLSNIAVFNYRALGERSLRHDKDL